jgi:hypothetical protein
MSSAVQRRLPIAVVVRRSFAFAWESRAVLGPPFAIFAIVTILADLALGVVDAKPSQRTVFLLNGAEELFGMMLAVGVHRYVLLAEASRGWRFFHLDRYFLLYLRATLVLALLAVVAMLPIVGVANAGGAPGSAGALSLIGLATIAAGAVILARLSMILPAAAIGDHRPIRALWLATHGNGLRLIAVSLLTAFPFVIADAVVFTLAGRWGQDMGTIRFAGLTIASELMSAAQLIVVTMMLSLSYDALIRGGGPDEVA